MARLCAATLAIPGKTEASPEENIAVGPIDQTGYVTIGGIPQWIAIQGESRANPVILYPHGGPGEAQSPFLKRFEPWERNFTVVNWDQRGAGKTFEKNGRAIPDFTLARLADDAVEVTEYALRKLHKHKLIVVGNLPAPCWDCWWLSGGRIFITPTLAQASL